MMFYVTDSTDPQFDYGGWRWCKLDPGLKAPGFKNFNLMKDILAFNLNPGFVSELAPLRYGTCLHTLAQFKRRKIMKTQVTLAASLKRPSTINSTHP